MKRRAVVVAVAALAISLLGGAAADARSLSSAKRGGLTINFRLVKKHGKLKVVNFRFSGLPITCDEGDTLLNSGRYPDMRVNRQKRFHGALGDELGRVVVKGKFKNHFRRAVGTLRGTGDFGTDPEAVHNCDSGVVGWRAGRGGPSTGSVSPGRTTPHFARRIRQRACRPAAARLALSDLLQERDQPGDEVVVGRRAGGIVVRIGVLAVDERQLPLRQA